MIFIFAACILVGLLGCRPVARGTFNKDCLSVRTTTCINGVFVLLVMLSHFYQYAGGYLVSPADGMYADVRAALGQTVVVTFFFFSGFGIMEQIKKRRQSYVKTMITHRFLKVLLHFDIAILIFWVVGMLIGQRDSLPDLLVALTAWSKLSVGNSNWFIFTTLCMYVAVYISFMIFRRNDLFALICMTLLTGVYVVLMLNSVNNASRWYNTVFCFAAGMWLSYFKERAGNFFERYKSAYYPIFVACIGLTAAVYMICGMLTDVWSALLYNVYSICFVLVIILFAMKFTVGNRVTYWLGKHTFSIYILQRIPYIVFRYLGLREVNVWLYFAVCAVSTILIAWVFDLLVGRLDSIIWRSGLKKPGSAKTA